MATIKYAAEYTNIEELVEFWETHPFGDDREASAIADSVADSDSVAEAASANSKASSLTSYSPIALKKASVFFKLAPAAKIEKIDDSYSLFDYKYCMFSQSGIGTLLFAETNAVIIEKNGVPFIEQTMTEEPAMTAAAPVDNDFKSLVDSVLL